MKTKRICREKTVKFFVSVLCIAMILSTTSGAFAAQNVDRNQIESNRIANQVINLVGNDNVLEKIQEEKNNYIPVAANTEISIPKEGDGKVRLSVGDEDISMSLPEQVKNCEGVLTNEGAIVYDSQSDVDVIVQATEEAMGKDETRNTVRSMVSIKNSDAPKEYSFNYDLPNGYRLMMGSELGNDEIPNDAVGIINEEGYAVSIIDSPWAKDANGKELGTYYSIEGSNLIQTVEFDENTHFPVTADPSTIVDKRTRTATHKVVTGWHTVGGQPADGYVFRTGGSIGWYYGVGTSKSMSVKAQLTTETLTVNFMIGIAKTSSAGTHISVNFPASTKAKKIIAKHHLSVTEKSQDYKYKNTKITDNGKTTTTTYQWVTVRNWIDKVVETRPEYDLKVV